jgi:hypothetical protein
MNAPDIMLAVAKVLEDNAVPYMLVGSFSSNLYGIPRSTKDADFVIHASDDVMSILRPALEPQFKIDPQLSFESATGTMRYRMSHRASTFMVELFLLSDDPHDALRFQRRKKIEIAGQTVSLPAVEDVIVTKLRWSGRLARPKDRNDVLGILLTTPPNEIDLDYVRHWCKQHGSLPVLETLLIEAQSLRSSSGEAPT